ncbi:hypothetical protein R5R35_013993 [Gryllus longicercus]|uniref:Accessory gland protein n=1 Tax=Gryllus longicercus TaxID=2509291 RepID=A0AAN9WF15_9ORTH
MLALPWVVLLLASSARARPGPGPTRAPPPDLHRFLADLSYLERAFPCTEAERACLEHGRLLHADGNCYRVREQGPCAAGELFRVNKTEALRGGLLRGTCSKQCVGARQPLAASGECRSAEWVENEVCRSEWGLQPTVDIFGEWVCKCLTPDCAPAPSTPAPSPLPAPSPAPSPAAPPADASTPPPAATPPPPLPAGCCRAPDLSRPTPVPYYDDRLALFGFWVPCSEAEHGCLKRGRVRASGSCHALRSRGPCGAGEELVLDAEALHYPYNPARARLVPKCAPRRCPDGGVFLPADGRCHPEDEVQRWLCAGKPPVRDEFGGWGCWRHLSGGADLSTTRRDNGRCELPPSAMWY